jgi:hypothetical protein
LNQLNEQGIPEIQIESFIVQIHKKCVSANISPALIFDICKQISELKEVIPISHLPEYISKRVQKKRAMEHELKILSERKENAKKEYNDALADSKVGLAALDQYKNTENRLQRYGISLKGDLEKLANTLDNMNNSG